jgi:hypothetical protein
MLPSSMENGVRSPGYFPPQDFVAKLNRLPLNSRLMIAFLLLNLVLIFRPRNHNQTGDGGTSSTIATLDSPVLNKLEELTGQLDVILERKNQFPKQWISLCHAQAKQDQYMYNNFFSHLGREGIFVEFGARDGIDHSNSYFFEHALNWRGMMVEASDKDFAKLVMNRPNTLIAKGAVCPKKGTVKVHFA